ncbi:hypothetical protein ILUMI_13042 [Ignelater luminosus]|uniref:PiggyBac transposable element-derived protein domain-containing protein n=1 Tax=Ignelater luminosus TaxID=2038154 RepID=A0A8K0G674_IGNLU|nr:hypothetical protein ILUMI_13042 [Ignelater luminosus]
MRTIVLKLFCWLCLTTIITTNVLAYQNTNSKTAYIETQWRHKLNTKDHSNNRYASLLMGSNSGSNSISSSTTNYPSWYKYDNNNKQITHSNSYGYNFNTNNNNNGVRIRHSKYPNLDNLITRLDNMQSTTTPPPPTTSSPYQNRHHQNIKNSDKLFYNNYNDMDDLDYEDEEDNEDLEPDYDKWGYNIILRKILNVANEDDIENVNDQETSKQHSDDEEAILKREMIPETPTIRKLSRDWIQSDLTQEDHLSMRIEERKANFKTFVPSFYSLPRTPLQIFQFFFPRRSSNTYCKRDSLLGISKGTKLEFGVEKMKAFIGVLLVSNYNVNSRRRMYWEESDNIKIY